MIVLILGLTAVVIVLLVIIIMMVLRSAYIEKEVNNRIYENEYYLRQINKKNWL